LDKELLDRIHIGITSGKHGLVDRFLIIRNGRLVVDHAYEHDYEQIHVGRDQTPHAYNYHSPDWHPYYQASDLHAVQSVTKSVTALVIGVAIQRGEFPDLSEAVLSFFDDYDIQNLDERKRQITIEDLLTMRAGFEWDEASTPYDDPQNSCVQLESSEDWIQFVLDRPMSHAPGEVFVYNSGASQLFSVIIEKTTGLKTDEYAAEHLFKPLGISETYWKKTPKGWPDTEGGLYLKPEDLAKIGYLVLHDGVWNGVQIISSEWVKQMTSPHVVDAFLGEPEIDWGYGYQWWLLGDDSQDASRVFAALGFGGQRLFIVPELDLIAVFNAWNIGHPVPSTIDLFMEEILPSIPRG
jgi:CubicO group peptidase (beta-lactamase class C family)